MAIRASRARRRIWSSESDMKIAALATVRARRLWAFSLKTKASLAYYIGHLRRCCCAQKTGNRRKPPLAHVRIPPQLFLERSGDRSRDREHAHLRARQGDRAR